MTTKFFDRGYVLIYMPDHPKARSNGCVYEHMLVAESMIGRPLNENEHVHHMDMNKSNNRHDNLLVLESSQHSKLHHWINNGMPLVTNEDYECKTVYCKKCEKVLVTEQKDYCSVECYSIGQRKAKRPSKEDLTKEINEMSWVAIGRKYNVTDNAIRKWARKYDLI